MFDKKMTYTLCSRIHQTCKSPQPHYHSMKSQTLKIVPKSAVSIIVYSSEDSLKTDISSKLYKFLAGWGEAAVG